MQAVTSCKYHPGIITSARNTLVGNLNIRLAWMEISCMGFELLISVAIS